MFLRKNNESNIWQSVSDLMTGLVIIFLFISILYVAQSRHVVYQYKEVNNQIYEDLMSEFTPEDLKEFGAEIDKNELVIRFQSDKLFANNETSVNKSFQKLLDSFWPRFAKIALNEKYADDVKEIRIEGHSSKIGQYEYNLFISQERAKNTLFYVRLIDKANRKCIEDKVTAAGFSYSRPRETEAASRRIEFKIITDSDKVLNKLYEGL